MRAGFQTSAIGRWALKRPKVHLSSCALAPFFVKESEANGTFSPLSWLRLRRACRSTNPVILTLYLSRVLGLALIALGVIIALRHRYYIALSPTIVTERMTRMVFATFALIGGLLLAVYDTLWQTLQWIIISIIGWIVVVEALVYLTLPDATLAKLIAAVNKPVAYIVGGVIAVIVGAYLTIVGFGLLI